MSVEQRLREAVASWFLEALSSKHMGEYGFDSIHLDELIDDYDEERSSQLIIAGYRELLHIYNPYSLEFMAWLVVVLGSGEAIDIRCPEFSDLQAEWDHWTPPELYLSKRLPSMRPFIVEEYKKPISLTTDMRAEHGVILGYYRCHQQYPGAEFVRGVYVEHYPQE